MILPANFANQVREGEDINFCPYCSRILYYEEVSEDQQEDYINLGVAGSLAGLDEDFKDEDPELVDEEEREVSEFDEDEDGEYSEDSEDQDNEDSDDDDDDQDDSEREEDED